MTGRALCATAVPIGPTSPSHRPWSPADALELPAERSLVLHTRPSWRWESLETARIALLAEVRAALPHRALLPDDRAVVLGPDGDAWRLWVISPDLPTLADDLCAGAVLDATELSERWIDAWRSLRATLGARADALGPEAVARTARGWALLAFGEPRERPASYPIETEVASALGARLERAGAWPRAWAALAASARATAL